MWSRQLAFNLEVIANAQYIETSIASQLEDIENEG